MRRCPVTRFLPFGIALLISLFAVGAQAQFQSGNIYGTVKAKDGSLLPGVTVTLTGVGAPQTFITDSSGSFRFLNLSPGSYKVKAELTGMGSAVRNAVPVSVGQNTEVDVVISPSVAESITVTADAPL